jgi:uncharacterized membrane protein YccC
MCAEQNAELPPPPASANSVAQPDTRPDRSAETRVAPAQAFWQTLTHFDSTKVFPHRALRNAIGVVLPLVGGFLLQMPRGGLVIASGALNVSYSDGSDPYAVRAKRMLSASVFIAIAVFAGAISGTHQVLAIVLATIWAFVAGLLVAVGGASPDIGVISLVTLLIYAAQPLTPHQAAVSGLLALAGGILQTVLSVALWPVRRYDPECRVLANFFQELANRAQVSLHAMSAPMASVHSEQAQETLLGLGRDSGAESIRFRSLLNQGERVRLSLLRLSRLRLRMERERMDYRGIEILKRYLELASGVLQQISILLNPALANPAVEIDAQTLVKLDRQISDLRALESGASGSFLAAVAKDTLFQMDALNGQLRASLDLARHKDEPLDQDAPISAVDPPWRKTAASWAESLRASLNLPSPAFRHAVRLAALVALGDIAGRMVSWRRTYWLPMTIVLVLKPEFAATFSRGLLRIAGTIVGLLLATALFHLFPASVFMEVILIFVFVYLLRWVGPANYGIFGILVSALIVLLIAINGVSPKDVIWARGINTVAGGALTLVAYWLWPTWERTLVSERIAQLIDSYRNYLVVVIRSRASNPASFAELDRVRRGARIALSNLQASVDRLSSEPGTTAAHMSQLTAILASSHRLVHAIMALEAIFSQQPVLANSAPLKEFVTEVEKTLNLLATSLRGTRVMARDFPDLRKQYRKLVEASAPSSHAPESRFDPINMEADRITNSLNTLAEQIRERTRSPEFIARHKIPLRPQATRV